jgi:hypothetical protein
MLTVLCSITAWSKNVMYFDGANCATLNFTVAEYASGVTTGSAPNIKKS